MSKRRSSIQKLRDDIEQNQKQLDAVINRGKQQRRQLNLYENRIKTADNNLRKRRTHTLIAEGAELEFFFPGINTLPKPMLRFFLKKIKDIPEVIDCFDKIKKLEALSFSNYPKGKSADTEASDATNVDAESDNISYTSDPIAEEYSDLLMEINQANTSLKENIQTLICEDFDDGITKTITGDNSKSHGYADNHSEKNRTSTAPITVEQYEKLKADIEALASDPEMRESKSTVKSSSISTRTHSSSTAASSPTSKSTSSSTSTDERPSILEKLARYKNGGGN